MNFLIKSICAAAAFIATAATAGAQIGNPFIHDPSTIVECDGKYYTFGTGGGGLISEDGWHWESGAVRPGGGVAPDAMKIGDRYLVVYAAGAQGGNTGHKSRVYMMWNKTLDPNSPDFKYTDPVDIAGSDGYEDCDGIDPGLLMGPDGRLWLVYGTYFGYIRIVEMDPKTGLVKPEHEPVDLAISCEAAQMFYEDGWYYLLATHGTCCDGMNSTYETIVGRSRNPRGPYIDNIGRDMIQGGGKLVFASEKHRVGAGHMTRYIIGEGVEKCAVHFEGDLDLGGRSTLAIRPLLWVNGWPKAGEILADGNYGIVSERRGNALELSVKTTRMQGSMRGGFGGFTGGPGAGAPRPANGAAGAPQGPAAGAPQQRPQAQPQPIVPMPDQKLEDVIDTWPAGDTDLRLGADMYRPHQNWEITAVPDAGGYLGGAYYKIIIAGTKKALTATEEKEVIAAGEYTGADNQLWRIDQLTDGTYRIMPKAIPGCDEELALIAVADATPTLGRFDFESDNSKWYFRKH